MNTRRQWALLRFALTASFLFVVWLLFTFSLDFFTLASGLVGSLFISFITFRVFIPEHDASLHALIPRPLLLVKFLLMLIRALYASSVSMLVTIIKNNPSPKVVHFRTRLHSDVGRMVLANSITFTPGTITLDLNDDHLTVHWFSAYTSHSRGAGDAIKGKMEAVLLRVWE